MIITFCGHSDFQKTDEYEKKFLDVLSEKIGNECAEMFLGGYGGFDGFAYYCCKKYKENHPNISLVLVTAYLTSKNTDTKNYDSIIYPEIEDKPKRFAISYRNKYMVEKSDCVIAYVNHSWGGAYQLFKHAKKKGKIIINLAEFK